MAAPEPIDLRHLGADRVIGAYVVDVSGGPALFDCGPATCVDALRRGLRDRGLELRDVRHLLLSHIHLDHAGAAGALVREHPGLRVHVSAIGAPHLIDPTRLERSARRLYGDAFDTLWGELVPVPERNVCVVGDEAVGLECFPTPGHASHHVSYLADDGTLYAGDAAGVRIQPALAVLPPTPPPDFDLEAWRATIEEVERRGPERLALTHFGLADDPGRHLGELRDRLEAWVARVEAGVDEAEFVRLGLADLGDVGEQYDRAMPLWQSYAGLKRYSEKRAAT